MSLKKRLMAAGVVALVAALAFGIAKAGIDVVTEREAPVFTREKETLYLWYTDEALTSFISSAAVTYNETHDVRIMPVLEKGPEYLEKINEASLHGEVPDLYILGHDSLEKSYLAGLACEVEAPEGVSLEETYRNTGLQAVSYKDKVIGYPFYFETSSLLYNKTYLEDMARAQLTAEADLQAAQEAERELEQNGPREEIESAGDQEDLLEESGQMRDQIEERMAQLLPSTIEGIRDFADGYDAPEQVEAVFRWDVTDIFYNYFFVGNAIDMGGEAGWDTSRIDIYNENAISNMRAYAALNQFFSIDTGDVEYEKVIDEFISGKLVFTVATTDVVSRLEQAREDGLFAYDYGIALTPDIDGDKKSRSLSMTSCVVVNGYSEFQKEANDFAVFLTSQYNDILYARSGKVSAARNVNYGYEALEEFAREYERSISMPKMLETSNFWVLLEAAFSQVWNGADANLMLKELSEQIMQQVTGEPFEEEYIQDPVEEDEEEEYLDEDFYRQEAMEEDETE